MTVGIAITLAIVCGTVVFVCGLRLGLAIRDAEGFDRDVRMSSRDNYGEDEGLE